MATSGHSTAARPRTRLGTGALGLLAALAFAVGATPASASAPTAAQRGGAASSPSVRDGEIVELWNYNSQHCLSVGAGSTAGGAGIIQWSCYGGAEQYWGLYPMPNSGGGYEIVNKNSGKCLADPASSPNAGVQLIQYGCDKGPEQTWYFGSNPDTGFAQISNRASGLCAAVGGSSTTPGAPVVQWPCTGGSEQRWTTSG
ncbi:RICIN domain-containing protein [Kitasatospora sp. NPDC056273]|uniref:RICIN domain-containing protein n=1 Tax=Kitasatospora sp. NPDC056273 TaxID=3345769 RepID=UPI0035DFE235